VSDDETRSMAVALLQLADAWGIPDLFWANDPRIRQARNELRVPPNGRHTHAHLWNPGAARKQRKCGFQEQ
jgi:hypothetical protein